MSNMVADEDLLGEDDSDGADFDITDEKEEELLQEDDYSKSRDVYDGYTRKDSISDVDEQDILNLDAEEDFQDVDEKPSYEEEQERKDEDSSLKKPETVVPEEIQTSKQNASTTKILKNNNAPPQKLQKTNFTKKKILPRYDKNRRGGGRGGFQARGNFPKNNQQRRRNGTVLINPRFEGTVHVKDNNARLAWDNSQYLQHNSNSIQPWGSGSFDVIPQEQLIKSILITSAPLLTPPIQQQSLQNFYEPPPPERPLFFEPPPSIQDSTYGGQSQVPNHEIYPPPQPNTYTTGSTRGTHPPYKDQLSSNRSQEVTYGYNDYTSYDQYSRPNQPQYAFDSKHPYSNESSSYNKSTGSYALQKDVQQKSMTCTPSTDNQNRYSNYGNDLRNNYNFNNKGKSYERNNDRQESFNSGNNYNNSKFAGKSYVKKQESTARNASYNTNYTEYQNKNTSSFDYDNSPSYQNQFKSNSNVLLSPTKTNIGVMNQNNKDNRVRRFPSNENFKSQMPEKKPKTSGVVENTNFDDFEKYESSKNDSSTTAVPQVEEEEDEETRLYRLKIEEQKKERERLLRIKEERRKQMMLQKRKQEEDMLAFGELEKQESSQTEGSTNDQKTNNFEHMAKTGFDQNSNQNLAPSGPIQDHYRSNYSGNLSYQKSNQRFNSSDAFQQLKFHSKPTDPVLRSSSTLQKHVQFSSVSSSGSATDVANVAFKVDNQDNLLSKKVVTETSSFMSNRVVVVKSKNNQKVDLNSNQTFTTEAKNESSNVSSFLNNRKVLKKDNTLPNTRLVVVNNLSTTINRNKLVALTRGIGEIQNLEVDKQERQATILFKSVASAHVFFKKYQRRILDDLSVIEVKLEPMTST